MDPIDARARALADTGDAAKSTMDLDALRATVDANIGDLQFVEGLGAYLIEARDILLPPMRPFSGKMAGIYNAVQLARSRLTRTSQPVFPDESSQFVRKPFPARSPARIVETMEHWIFGRGDQFFDLPLFLAFLRKYAPESKMFYREVSQDFFHAQVEPDFTHYDVREKGEIGISEIALENCPDRLFEMDDNLDLVWIPAAREAARMFISKYE